jgi:hypothetical protein
MRDQFRWARLLAFVTGLVNQELLLRNEYGVSVELERKVALSYKFRLLRILRALLVLK